MRIPRKLNAETHRGFGFVDYFTKENAKKAFETLSGSVHLYGRRLVLEWAEDEGVDEIRKRTAAHFNDTRPNAKKSKAVFTLEPSAEGENEKDE